MTRIRMLWTFLVIFAPAIAQIVEAQTEGDLRLVDGSSDLEGRLEIYHNYAWGTICDDYFDLADADVACRQLGFTSALAVKERAYFGSAVSGTVIWLDNVDCTGRESMLTYCGDRGWGVTNCGHNEDVGIICTYSSAREGDLRLVDGRDLDEGRVEIYHNGVWGTICNDYWAYDEARVACRQLGYNGVTYSNVRYDPGQDPIHLDNVMCYGYEARLIDCYSMVWGNANCGHNEDVGINCARSNSNSNLEGWAISLIVIGSLLFFGLFAVVVGKVCSKPRSKRNASSAVMTSNETAPVQTYPMQVGSAYPPPTTSYPPQAASTAPMTAPYPPNAMAFQAYPPTVSGMSAAPPAYYPVPTVPTGNPTSMPLPGSGEAASSP